MGKVKYRFNTKTLTYEKVEQKKFSEMGWKFFLNTFMTIFGLFGTVLGIYSFYADKNASLEYEILSNTNVLDINADITKLDVLYGSTSLKNTFGNLRIITLKIINNGSTDILKNQYDENDLPGLSIIKGKIIESPEIIETSNKYIKKNLKLLPSDTSTIKFSNIIIESNEYFIIKMLVIHKKNVTPEIKAFGKIAGQKEIRIKTSDITNKKESIWQETYAGSIWAQILRSLSYPSIIILFGILVGFSLEKIKEKLRGRKRARLIMSFKKQKNYLYSKSHDPIFEKYFVNGSFSFSAINRLLNNETKLNTIYEQLQNSLPESDRKVKAITEKRVQLELIEEMIESGIIIKHAGSIIINQALKGVFIEFFEYLISKGEAADYNEASYDDF